MDTYGGVWIHIKPLGMLKPSLLCRKFYTSGSISRTNIRSWVEQTIKLRTYVAPRFETHAFNHRRSILRNLLGILHSIGNETSTTKPQRRQTTKKEMPTTLSMHVRSSVCRQKYTVDGLIKHSLYCPWVNITGKANA